MREVDWAEREKYFLGRAGGQTAKTVVSKILSMCAFGVTLTVLASYIMTGCM